MPHYFNVVYISIQLVPHPESQEFEFSVSKDDYYK